MRTTVVRWCALVIVFGLLAILSAPAYAQELKSVGLVKELTQLLEEKKLDAIAAKDPSGADAYGAALYFPGSQLLVVSARYAVPQIMNEKLAKKEYRDIYTDLNSACVEGSKSLVIDIGADGLKPKKEEAHVDTTDVGQKSYTFDGDWKKAKLDSEEEYNKVFTSAEDRYVKILTVLIAQAKKG